MYALRDLRVFGEDQNIMSNSIVTVFGGSGFLGRHLVQRLVDRETALAAIDHRSGAPYAQT